MKLIVGLGNPGGEYKDTRHNVGFMVIDKLARELSNDPVTWEESDKFKAVLARIGEVILIKPITFMNMSGVAVSAIMKFYKLAPSDIWVIHDDIDLPLGKIRIREKGSSGGHKGIDSIITSLSTNEFVRFRMGVGRKSDKIGHFTDKVGAHQSVISFVLSRFSQGEAGELKHLIKRGSEAVRHALDTGIDKAMGEFN